jgi:hypothetical protein
VETVEEDQESQHATTSVKEEVKARPPAAPPDEDIFGKHLAGIIPTDMTDPPNVEEDADSSSNTKRPKVPQQILDNKAVSFFPSKLPLKSLSRYASTLCC